MQIENRPISEIIPYGKNAKKHPDKQVLAVANSIKEFGFNQPIVVDKNNVIIVGHGRFLAATFLEMTEVPVLTLDVSEEQAKAYRLADNKLNESQWDMQLVIQELKEMSMPMLDLTGFDRRLVFEDEDKDDRVPELPKGKPRTELGDVYLIGRHKIVCGDSTHAETYVKLLELAAADMVFTDPPYNVNYHGGGANTSEGIMNDKMGAAAFKDFLSDTFGAMHAVVKGGAGLYIFHAPVTQAIFEEALKAKGFDIKYQLIWNKPSAGLGGGALQKQT